MTLWCIFRSPLMFGGHLPESGSFALRLISNAEVLALNQHSRHNHSVCKSDTSVTWIADASDDGVKYLAPFNIGQNPQEISFHFSQEKCTEHITCKTFGRERTWAFMSTGSRQRFRRTEQVGTAWHNRQQVTATELELQIDQRVATRNMMTKP